MGLALADSAFDEAAHCDDQPRSPGPRSSSACRRDGSSKTHVAVLRRRARIRPMPKTRNYSERTMIRLSEWIAGVLVVTCAFMCAAAAQTRARDMSQAPGILPSGLGDA